MSKQKNKKFKKNKASRPTNHPVMPQQDNIATQTETNTAALVTPETDPMVVLDQEYAYVRKDVKLILLTILLLAILIVAAYFVGLKTDYLNNLGNWIYKICNLQT